MYVYGRIKEDKEKNIENRKSRLISAFFFRRIDGLCLQYVDQSMFPIETLQFQLLMSWYHLLKKKSPNYFYIVNMYDLK